MKNQIKAIVNTLGVTEAEAHELMHSSLPRVYTMLLTLKDAPLNNETRALLHQINNALPCIGAFELQNTVKQFEIDVERTEIDWNDMPPFYAMRLNQIKKGLDNYLLQLS